MKTFILSFIVIAMSITLFGTAAAGADHTRPILVSVEDSIVEFPDAQPYVMNGRTYVPIRFFARAMDANVHWDNERREARLTRGDRRLVISTANETITFSDGTVENITVPVEQGRIMLPYRIIAEEFGFQVHYYPEGPVARVTNEAELGKDAFLEVHSDTIAAFRGEEPGNGEATAPVYFTFDDGPNQYTDDILDILGENNAEATFFMLRNNMYQYPETVRRIVREGHAVGCHGVSHDRDVFYRSPERAYTEMRYCFIALKQITGREGSLIRTPYGSMHDMTEPFRDRMDEAGYQMWDWNIDTRDWDADSPEDILDRTERLLDNVEQRGESPIVLMHDLEVTIEALPEMIELFEQRGYHFDTLTSDMEPYNFWTR